MSILNEIIAHKRDEVEAAISRRPLGEIRAELADCTPLEYGRFERALREGAPVALIAEIKKASPSKGMIRKDFDPADLARAYAAGGASALSILTDRKFFQGNPDYIDPARESSGLPVLRKDFILTQYQVFESTLLGVDCILLIAAVLDGSLLTTLTGIAAELGMDCLVEVHTEAEAALAAKSGARIVGVNNRDLNTFQVSLETSERLAPCLPKAAVKVSESGISTPADISRLAACGYNAVLVGESLLRKPDLAVATRDLLGR